MPPQQSNRRTKSIGFRAMSQPRRQPSSPTGNNFLKIFGLAWNTCPGIMTDWMTDTGYSRGKHLLGGDAMEPVPLYKHQRCLYIWDGQWWASEWDRITRARTNINWPSVVVDCVWEPRHLSTTKASLDGGIIYLNRGYLDPPPTPRINQCRTGL